MLLCKKYILQIYTTQIFLMQYAEFSDIILIYNIRNHLSFANSIANHMFRILVKIHFHRNLNADNLMVFFSCLFILAMIFSLNDVIYVSNIMLLVITCYTHCARGLMTVLTILFANIVVRFAFWLFFIYLIEMVLIFSVIIFFLS